jgi:hypothetical protein
VRDLVGLSPKTALDLKEDKDRGVYVKGLSQNIVKDVDQIMVTLLLHCCYAVVTLLLRGCYTVVTLLLRGCYTVVTLLLHCYNIVGPDGGGQQEPERGFYPDERWLLPLTLHLHGQHTLVAPL